MDAPKELFRYGENILTGEPGLVRYVEDALKNKQEALGQFVKGGGMRDDRSLILLISDNK